MPKQQSEQDPRQSEKRSSLGISLGFTEWMFILGFIALTAGVFLRFGVDVALCVSGALLLFTAFYNAQVG